MIFLNKNKLLDRLDEIAKSISNREHTIALLGLGSVGVELDRLDRYSDLDFFIIVENEFKDSFIDDLTWLEDTYPLAYAFKNSNDGYKILFEDGIYGEYAVFGLNEVDRVTQAEGRIVWINKNYKLPKLTQTKGNIPILKKENIEFRINEALTNIFVGLLRALRGEKLSAYRFIETHAFNNLLGIIHHFENESKIHEDLFNIERRFESHYPQMKNHLKTMLSGYNHLAQSAKSILSYISNIYEINPTLKQEIEVLIHKLEKEEQNKNEE
jgi:lincosamide nucleotidyltransferase B/F